MGYCKNASASMQQIVYSQFDDLWVSTAVIYSQKKSCICLYKFSTTAKQICSLHLGSFVKLAKGFQGLAQQSVGVWPCQRYYYAITQRHRQAALGWRAGGVTGGTGGGGQAGCWQFLCKTKADIQRAHPHDFTKCRRRLCEAAQWTSGPIFEFKQPTYFEVCTIQSLYKDSESIFH